MSFSETLKRLRLEKGLTQGDLAKYSGLKQSSIAMYETGKRNPKIDVLERLADFFNVDIDYLIGKTDKTTKVIVAPPEPQKSIEAPPAPQKSGGLPELNARDERDIQKRLKSMLDDLDPNAGLAYYNGQEPMDDETRDLIRAALENSLRVAKQIAKAKYTPKKYRKTDDTAARIGKKILDASPSAQMAVSQIIDEDKGDDLTDKK